MEAQRQEKREGEKKGGQAVRNQARRRGAGDMETFITDERFYPRCNLVPATISNRWEHMAMLQWRLQEMIPIVSRDKEVVFLFQKPWGAPVASQ